MKNVAHQLKYRIEASPKAFQKPVSFFSVPHNVEAGTNTDVNIYPPPASVSDLYPALPRDIKDLLNVMAFVKYLALLRLRQ